MGHITLGQYVRRRNGVPLGARGSMQNMLSRSLGASSFARFWRYWNPIFGYGLSRYVFSPAHRMLPRWLALVLTFLVCGALHDLVTFLFWGYTAFLFTQWFLFMSIGVLAGEALRMDTSALPWPARAAINLSYVGACLALTLLLRSTLFV